MPTFDIILFVLLLPLLVMSAFFSGSETALFGLSADERLAFGRRGTPGRAALALLSDPRALLITILLGNMVANVTYFVISSVLLMRTGGGWLVETAIAAGTLLVIVLFGEVMPKMVANAARTPFCLVTAGPLLAIHRLNAPLRYVVQRVVIEPLNRLTAPSEAPPQLDADELAALLDLSGEEGVIDLQEQQVLRDVIALRDLKVRDVMTPRVQMKAVPAETTPGDVRAILREKRLTQIPVYRHSVDQIIGMLHVKRYLLDPRHNLARATTPVSFVPEIATLDQLLEHFRGSGNRVAMVVDEFGGTAGVVSIEDVVEEIVGEITGTEDSPTVPTTMVGLNRWRVGGDIGVHDWAEIFGHRIVSPRVATLGGLIIDHLGRVPQVGDVVDLGNVHLEVESVENARVASVIITLGNEPPPGRDNASDREGGDRE